jgi:hypothetical protein
VERKVGIGNQARRLDMAHPETEYEDLGTLERPWKINDVKISLDLKVYDSLFTGRGLLVKVRPCGDEYEGKTYVGLLLGDMKIGCGYGVTTDGVLEVVNAHKNPAIYMLGPNQLIFGCESFWGVIENEEELDKLITDSGIQNIWYVRALKELLVAKAEQSALKRLPLRVDECERCGEEHASLTFIELQRQQAGANGTDWDYWASCPTTGEPLMVTFPEDPAEQESGKGSDNDN